MIVRAKENAKENSLENVDFYSTDLFKEEYHEAWLEKKYDKILLDPPRVGAQNILRYFNKVAAKKIIYVSCNPGTLARDAGELVHQHQYILKQVGIMNMFPHTSHIEAMAVFEKHN
jgi:23S rRNA (uracil1939-C5)-methyltransferase